MDVGRMAFREDQRYLRHYPYTCNQLDCSGVCREGPVLQGGPQHWMLVQNNQPIMCVKKKLFEKPSKTAVKPSKTTTATPQMERRLGNK